MLGVYISQTTLALSKNMADSKREVAALPVEAMCSLDAVFQKSRLPSRALQVGGWLAKRYSSLGKPWPHLAAALGVSLLPVAHSAATGKVDYLPKKSIVT